MSQDNTAKYTAELTKEELQKLAGLLQLASSGERAIELLQLSLKLQPQSLIIGNELLAKFKPVAPES